MVHISPGATFSDNAGDVHNLLTAPKLHDLIDNANVTAIADTEFDGDARLIETAGSAPSSPSEGDLWYDTALDLWRIRNDGRWDAQTVGPEMTNNTGSTIPAFSLVKQRAGVENEIELTDADNAPGVLGVTTATAANSATTLVKKVGSTSLLAKGPISRADLLVSSASDPGYAVSATALSFEGNFTGGIDFGIALTGIAGTATGYITAAVWK